MTRTVDLVISSGGSAARAAAVQALKRGQRVLVVLRSGDGGAGRRLRRCLRSAAASNACQLTVMTNSEVVCADGREAVEAVVVRHRRTGRLAAVNASAFKSFDGSLKHSSPGASNRV